MPAELIGLLGGAALLVLILLRVPVALAMLTCGMLGTWALSLASPFVKFGPYLLQFKTALWSVLASYDLSVVPLFILMGFLAGQTGLSRDLFEGLGAVTRPIRGGVVMATILACAGFGAVSGSSIATAATMSRVALPQLRRLGHDEGLATGALAAGGTLGILIPPSVALVVYAVVVEAPIIEMFQAAIIPGTLAVAFFVLVVAFKVWREPSLAPAVPPLSEADRARALRRLWPVGVIFGSIILGLGMGIFAPTPAAGVGVFLLLAHGIARRKITRDDGLTRRRLRAALLSTAKTSSMIYFILFAADILKGFFARSGLPAYAANWAGGAAMDPYLILIVMLVILIVLGCFMESLSMILVVVPFFWPVLIELNGGDYIIAEQAAFGLATADLKIWFGILALIVVELGLITPPMGLNVFVIKSFSPQTGIGVIFRGVLPFFAIELCRVAILLLVPGLSLYLAHLL